MHHFTHAIGKPQGTRFRYARESASEVGVVLHRHEAIQGEHSDGCIETRLIACLLIDAAAGRHWVDYTLDAQRFG